MLLSAMSLKSDFLFIAREKRWNLCHYRAINSELDNKLLQTTRRQDKTNEISAWDLLCNTFLIEVSAIESRFEWFLIGRSPFQFKSQQLHVIFEQCLKSQRVICYDKSIKAWHKVCATRHVD